VLAGLLAACSDGSLGPELGEEVGSATITAQSAALPTISIGAILPVEDALERVLGALPDSPPRQEIRAALVVLGEAVQAGDGCAIRTSRMRAERALRDLGRGLSDEHGADLDAVGLALESVEQTGKGKC
jgi:hypothetical protein